MEMRDNTRKPTAGHQLPQWNSKFRFSAQKHDAAAEDGATVKANERRTPLGQPRRVLVGKDKGAKETKGADSKAHASCKSGSHATPGDCDKTPTICLFHRFESLTINTPATGTTALSKAACAAGSTVVEPGAKPCRSVAFGTPSMLTYTPTEAAAAAHQDDTPLWSNAGHTPYSLEGAAVAVGCVRECLTADRPGSHNDGVCMELFTSVITDTGAERTPAATKTCPKTPAVANAEAAALEALPVKTAAAGTVARMTDSACTPKRAAESRANQQHESNDCNAAAVVSAPQFTGFTTGKDSISTSREGDGTPPFISMKPSHTPGVESNGTINTPAPTYAVDDCRGLRLPAPTPRSKLKQPARVPVAATRPAVAAELKQLLGNNPGVVTAAGQAGEFSLGSCDILSPVRPKKKKQYTLGAEQQVLTPVRRSARKATQQQLATDVVHVQPMLEATNYCYQPNEALQIIQHNS